MSNLWCPISQNYSSQIERESLHTKVRTWVKSRVHCVKLFLSCSRSTEMCILLEQELKVSCNYGPRIKISPRYANKMWLRLHSFWKVPLETCLYSDWAAAQQACGIRRSALVFVYQLICSFFIFPLCVSCNIFVLLSQRLAIWGKHLNFHHAYVLTHTRCYTVAIIRITPLCILCTSRGLSGIH